MPRSHQASAASSEQNLWERGVKPMADVQIGYAISSEEHLPNDIVQHARLAEEAGFHLRADLRPLPSLGRRPGTQPVRLVGDRRHRHGDGESASRYRGDLSHHPHSPRDHRPGGGHLGRDDAGRFFLGVGTGEALNEHITGERWPETDVRQEMLEEAIEIMRLLWQGGQPELPWRVLHRRERPPLHPAGGAGRGDDRRQRAILGRNGGTPRRRAHQHLA